ncbi:MAG: hypothetical protein KKD21_03920 [Proteobacteria bacterium]|nr:hypothetical protein [Pseudomonadota bacterium]MBU1696178.1 hypothetical protein [Pseudomonadota bacterium]
MKLDTLQRFQTKQDFGMLYGAIGDFFENEPTPLPILQLPEAIRSQDPN